jgi:hypothetical protein
MRKVPSTRATPAEAVLIGLKLFEQENGASPRDRHRHDAGADGQTVPGVFTGFVRDGE